MPSIEPINAAEIQQLATRIKVARELITNIAADAQFNNTLEDLNWMQQALNSKQLNLQDTVGLQCLGAIFGQVLISQMPGFQWWMVSDEHGKDPCLRYLETDLLLYPLTLISKRVEAGENVTLTTLLSHLLMQLKPIISDLEKRS